jgi:hypothetical protein
MKTKILRNTLSGTLFGLVLPHIRLVAIVAILLGSDVVRVQSSDDPVTISKHGIDIEIESEGRIFGLEAIQSDNVVLPDNAGPVPGLPLPPQVQLRGPNTQVNDPNLDNIQVFPGFRPFVNYTQSETSLAAWGQNLVATYNSSANQPLVQVPGGLFFTQRFLSGFSTSNDGGKTWVSGFIPPVAGSPFTFGDPAIDVDRMGNFYFSGLGADASGLFTIQVNKSTDGGRTWSNAVVVQQDDGGDKEWIAVGKDPLVPGRDNVYVTWTSFQDDGSAQLRFGRSTDAGATWATKTIFAPAADPDPTHPQNSLSFSQPYVDPVTGFFYVAFAQFSNADQDFLRLMVSRDAGETFSFVSFNAPGSPIPDGLPVTQSGEIIDMGSGGIRLGIHAGPPSAGRFGLRQFRQVSRLVTQPGFAARNGSLYLAWSNSTSNSFGDPNADSNILYVRSTDGGTTWTSPIQVNPSVAGDRHHVLPSLSIGNNPIDVFIAYYTQHRTSETVDVDLATSHDGGATFASNRNVRVTGTSFVLPPNVNRLTTAPTPTTNYDRTIQPGYSLGEYLSVNAANGSVFVLWGDARNTVVEPVNPLSPLSGVTHSQQDVFIQKVHVP